MPVQELLSAFNENDPGNYIDPSSDIAVCVNYMTRSANETFLSSDKGVGAIPDGFWYRTFFNLTSKAGAWVVSPIGVANETGDAQTLFTAATDAVFLWHQASSNRYRFWHAHGGANEVVDTTFALLLNNRYAHDLIRTGTSFTANLYDITGGHGTPGALVSTRTLNTALTLDDHRYLETAMNFSDGTDVVNTIDITFELWDMNAVGGVKIFPKSHATNASIQGLSKGGIVNA